MSMNYKYIYYVVCSFFLLTGCSQPFFTSDIQNISIIPAQHISGTNDIIWKFEYINETGRIIEIPISNIYEEIIIEAPSHLVFPLRIVPLLENTPVKNLLVSKEHLGMIVPISQEINLWSSACTDIFFKIIYASKNNPSDSLLYCSYFNWDKLEKTLYKYENPYELDFDNIAHDIAHGTFTSKSIKKPLR